MGLVWFVGGTSHMWISYLDLGTFSVWPFIAQKGGGGGVLKCLGLAFRYFYVKPLILLLLITACRTDMT
jgi:hypothetical protein